ncbi:MAG: hypothetical protein LH616_14040 [Ilumatobacteraceae bacterium]|nr:hypothetical protein [Ilumatobacteraceae bacterium]
MLVVGLVICIVGGHGERRATTWLGAALAAIGIVSLVAVQMEPSSASSAGAVAIVSGLMLVAIAALSAPIRAAIRNQQANDDSSSSGNGPDNQPSPFAPPAP